LPAPSPLLSTHPAPPLISTLSLHDALPISIIELSQDLVARHDGEVPRNLEELVQLRGVGRKTASVVLAEMWGEPAIAVDTHVKRDRKSTRLNSSHVKISYAVFCLKKKTKKK